MERATAPQLRESMELADMFKRAYIRFVPMPATDEVEYALLVAEMARRLEKIEKICAG